MASEPDLAVFFVLAIYLVGLLLYVVGAWKAFVKAGEPGWAILIPIFNIYVMCKIAGKPGWWVLLCFIPGVNLIAFVFVCIDIAKNFGKSTLFGVGIVLLGFVTWPILGFGNATYLGPRAFAR